MTWTKAQHRERAEAWRRVLEAAQYAGESPLTMEGICTYVRRVFGWSAAAADALLADALLREAKPHFKGQRDNDYAKAFAHPCTERGQQQRRALLRRLIAKHERLGR